MENKKVDKKPAGFLSSDLMKVEGVAEEITDLDVSEETSYSPDEVRKMASLLKQTVDISYLYLGKLLYVIKVRKLHEGWGFDEFQDYVASELGFKYRKAVYLISIWKRLIIDLGLKDTDIKGLPWTKLVELIGVVKNKDDFEEWKEEAKKLTVSELKSRVKEVKSGEACEVPTKVTLGLFEDQKKNFDLAVKNAKKLTKSDKLGHNLDCICLEFNATRGKTNKESLMTLLASTERVYDIKLIAVTNAGTVFHGEGLLES